MLLPVHNGAAYIQRCLYSLLLQQTMQEVEVLLVDDGSEDDTKLIAEAYFGIVGAFVFIIHLCIIILNVCYLFYLFYCLIFCLS